MTGRRPNGSLPPAACIPSRPIGGWRPLPANGPCGRPAIRPACSHRTRFATRRWRAGPPSSAGGDARHVAAAAGALVIAIVRPPDIAPMGDRVVTVDAGDFERLPARQVVEALNKQARVDTYA